MSSAREKKPRLRMYGAGTPAEAFSAAVALRGSSNHCPRPVPSFAMADAESVYQRRRIEKRMGSIEVVKRSASYLSYSSRVPRANRSDGEPRTPSPGATASTRQFRYRVKVWKQSLYEWNVMAALE